MGNILEVDAEKLQEIIKLLCKKIYEKYIKGSLLSRDERQRSFLLGFLQSFLFLKGLYALSYQEQCQNSYCSCKNQLVYEISCKL